MSSKQTRNSHTHPIRVDFLEREELGLSGRLGMTILPGVRDHGSGWDRDLNSDLDRLKHHYQADALVTLLEAEEFETYGVPDFLERVRETRMDVIHFPIRDVDTPRKGQSEEYAALIARIVGLLREGETVVVHCRGGLGRTGTVAASVLVAAGHGPDEAIRLVRKFRSDRAVETTGQERYVRRFAEEWRSRRGAARPPEKVTASRQGPTNIERYRGCLLGMAAGDALGTTVEFRQPGTFHPMEDIVGGGHFGLKAGEWTDDTSMALCLAESLIEKRGFDPADQLTKYVRWYREGHMSATGECFDIGGATTEALKRFESTGNAYSGSTDAGRAGNGSLMRLAPVPLFYARDDGRLMEAVERSGESSRTTHGARTAVDACRYMGALIAGAVNGASKEELLSERYDPAGGGYWAEHPLTDEVDEVAKGSFKRREPPEIRGRGYVVASLEAALWAFNKGGSFREGCLLAVNLGEDADTTGAIYGQLAGAFYGEEGIPKPWRQRLAHRLLIKYFAEKLFALAPRPSAGKED